MFRLLAFLLVLSAGLLGYVTWIVQRQGLQPEELTYEGAEIAMDANGIPTIEGPDWERVLAAQGFVHAANRMFHMDLLRRSASGRLSELFGPTTVDRDRSRREEDWIGVADRAFERLDPHQKKQIKAYTAGVNRFIREHEGRWGIEYVLLDLVPEPWLERDSVLVLLAMCDQLATGAPSEAEAELWRSKLTPEWFAFMFPDDHPWNEPLFGGTSARIELPEEKLPKRSIDAAELAVAPHEPAETLGASNSWGWCGKTGCFLANDPHLGATVPHLWFAVRLRVSPKHWVVGVSIPGLPGVVLGMNPHLAWAFTNVGEDVDDYLLERVDGDRYLASIEDGREIWKPIETKSFEISVRNGAPVKGTARFTHRGPLAPRPHLEGLYSRQWLPFQPGKLGFASRMNQATSWAEMNAALDSMLVPAQNVLILDRAGNLGYRASGSGIVRRVSGRRPQPALEGEWAGYQPASTRPRLLFYATGTATTARFIATANQRMWIDEFGHRWTEDLRAHRIREMLSARDDFSRADMNAMQLDTKSEYHRRLIAWVAARAAVPERWKKWSGVASEDPDTFTEATELDRTLVELCAGRVRERFGLGDARYSARHDSGWVLTVLEQPGALEVFGLDEEEVAEKLVEKIGSVKRAPYQVKNRWQAQHPFVGRLPLVGDLFRVEEHYQFGWKDVVRVEQPKYGASTRLVWDLADPKNSTWSLPVGQSGHVHSSHFADLQEAWSDARPMKVFDDDSEWWVAPGL
jgi:penicillin amidase